MAKITTHITLDVSKRSRLQAIAAKQYDRNSRYINVRLTNQGDFINIPLGSLVTINAERPDFESKSFAGEVNADGTVTVRITYWMLELEGIVSCDISVEDAQSVKLSSLNFTIEVEHANYSGTEISDDDPQYDVFIQVLAGEADRVAAENERKANETERKTSEAARAQAETTRQTNESTRQDNEAIRITNENARIAEEQNRAQAENARAQEFSTWEKQIDTIDSRSIRNSKRITNLEQGLPAEQFMTDSTVAHVKDVPVNALPFAEVSKVGGMTRKCTNLIPYPYYANGTHTLNGITWTVNADGSVIANGTATDNSIFVISNYKTPVTAGTYTLSGIPANGSVTTFMIQTADRNGFAKNNTNVSGDVFTLTTETSVIIQLVVFNGYTANNLVFKPMLNEGSTALPYEPYFEGLRDAKVTEMKSVGVNLFDAKNISSSTQYATVSLSGDDVIVEGTYYASFSINLKANMKYSISYGANGNRIQVNLKYKSGVLSRALTQKQTFIPLEDVVEIYLYAGNGDTKKTTYSNFIISEGDTIKPYRPYTKNSLPIPEAVQALDGYGEGNPDNAEEYNAIINKDGKWKYSHKGNIENNLWLPLATPEVTDISDLLSADNFLAVEGGGTVTAVNENGLEAPSEITYMLKETTV